MYVFDVDWILNVTAVDVQSSDLLEFIDLIEVFDINSQHAPDAPKDQ